MKKKTNTGRRKFIGWAFFSSLTAFFATIFYPILRFVMPPAIAESRQNSVTAATIDELKPNSGKIFPFNNRPAILIRLENGEYRSFTAVCTHLQCTVQYRDDWHIIWCACHNGKYDLKGQVISGPPPSPLEEYDVQMQDNNIIVSKRA